MEAPEREGKEHVDRRRRSRPLRGLTSPNLPITIGGRPRTEGRPSHPPRARLTPAPCSEGSRDSQSSVQVPGTLGGESSTPATGSPPGHGLALPSTAPSPSDQAPSARPAPRTGRERRAMADPPAGVDAGHDQSRALTLEDDGGSRSSRGSCDERIGSSS